MSIQSSNLETEEPKFKQKPLKLNKHLTIKIVKLETSAKVIILNGSLGKLED